MADLSSILGGMVQGFKDFGTGLVDLFGTGGAAIGDAISSIQTGRATTKNQDDFRKWLYNTDSTKDAAAKGLGTALNGVSTVADVIPGAQAVTANPLFNGIQGAIGGVADELKMNGENADWGRAAQRAGVGAASGLASGYAGQALGKSGNKLLSNGLTRGAVSGALGGGIANAGYTGIEGGSVQDMINAGLYGAQTGALVGGTTGLARELMKPNYKMDVALTDDEKAARIANIDDQLGKLDLSTPEGNARYNELTQARQEYSGSKPKTVADLMAEPKQKTVADLMLSPEQEEFFKDSAIRDENGNLKPMYHGTRGDFTVFGHGKTSSTSNSNSSVGYWFTPDENSAKNFADSTWYGEGDPKAMKTYLNIKNPKVYEAVDNSKAIESVTKRLRELELAPNKLSDTDLYYDDMYKASMVQNMVNQGDEDMAVKWLSDKGYSNDRAARLVDEIANIKKVLDEKENLLNEYAELRYGDAYEQFKTDLYKVDGQTAEDANAGGIGMALRDKDSIKKYVDGLKSQGYDGIIIKGTGYDADVMGGPNDQYVAFDPNQIKDVNNLKPTADADIMRSVALPGSNKKSKTTNGVKRIGSDNVAPVDESTLPKGWKELRDILDEKYVDDITSKFGYENGDFSKITPEQYEKYILDIQTSPGKKKGWQNQFEFKKSYMDADEYKNELKNIAIYEAKRKAVNDIQNMDLPQAQKNAIDTAINSMDYYATDDNRRYLSHYMPGAEGQEMFANNAASEADAEFSDRLGIGRSNTIKRNNIWSEDLNADGEYMPSEYALAVDPLLNKENAVSTLAHERLHSFQFEAPQGRYDKRVLDAYNELSKDLKPYLHDQATVDERYGKYYKDNLNGKYWASNIEQESRMMQQYLDNKGYTNRTVDGPRKNEYGEEINKAFDKFFKKLRTLSKKGVALPAVTALLGGGAIMAANQSDDKKKKSEVK